MLSPLLTFCNNSKEKHKLESISFIEQSIIDPIHNEDIGPISAVSFAVVSKFETCGEIF